MGQEREVTTVRFYVRDSFEEVSSSSSMINFAFPLLIREQQVMELQASKKHLAGVLLSPHDGGQTDDSLGGLHVCAQKCLPY